MMVVSPHSSENKLVDADYLGAEGSFLGVNPIPFFLLLSFYHDNYYYYLYFAIIIILIISFIYIASKV